MKSHLAHLQRNWVLFDYDCPAILQQLTAYDCGLAVVANSMAFLKHSKKLQFMKANMKRQKSNEVHFLLDEYKFSKTLLGQTDE